jgi:hypothetical protein
VTAFASLATALHRTLQGVNGTAVTYHRGASSVAVTAVRGRSEFERTDQESQPTTYTSEDWLIKAASLVINGVVITPRPNDRIKEVVGDTTIVYEVTDPASTGGDNAGLVLRVHCKRRGTE